MQASSFPGTSFPGLWVGGGDGLKVTLVSALVQSQSFVLLTWTWTKLNKSYEGVIRHVMVKLWANHKKVMR